MPRPAERSPRRRRVVVATSALALLLRGVDASLDGPPASAGEPAEARVSRGLGDVLLDSRTDPSLATLATLATPPDDALDPDIAPTPLPLRGATSVLSPAAPAHADPTDTRPEIKVGVGPRGANPANLSRVRRTFARSPRAAPPPPPPPHALDAAPTVDGESTAEERARRIAALVAAFGTRPPPPSPSPTPRPRLRRSLRLHRRLRLPSLSRGAFSSSIPPTSALSSTADAPLPAPPGGAGAPVVGTRVGAVDAPRAAPTPRAAASRAVGRRDGQTRPLIPAVAPGIRARRCHARASEPRRAPIVVAAAAVWSVERRVPREPRGRPVGRPDRASLVVGRVVAPSTTALESSPESSPNAFAAFPTASSLTPAAAPDARAPAEAVAPAAPEVRRGHGRPRCRRVRGAQRGGGGDGRSLHDPETETTLAFVAGDLASLAAQGRPQGLAGSGPSRPPGPDPLDVSSPTTGEASPATSAAPGTTHYESVAVSASAARDAVDRRLGNGGAAAAAGTALALGGGATSFLYSLWRDPSVAPFLVQTWGYLDGLVYPDGKS